MEIGQEKDKELKESSKQQDFSQINEELPKWLTEYLKDYRTKDQEQLVTALMDEHYEELSELLIEVQESDNLEKEQELLKDLYTWVIVALVYFPLLSPYLSPEAASEYADPLNSFYQTVIKDKRQSGSNEEELEAMTTLFAKDLGSYFQENLTVESVPDAPLKQSDSHPKKEAPQLTEIT